MITNENDKRNDERLIKPDENKLRTENIGIPPEEDPAVINPEELASFPKEKKTEDPDLDEERSSHLANKVTSPVRSGRNITNTGPKPDEDGFM